MLQSLIPNQSESIGLDNSNNLFVKIRVFIGKLLKTAKQKSLGQLISLAYSKTVDYLITVRYRLQYPNVKFGSGVRIQGKFSVKGKGRVEIGDYCVFVSFENHSNQIITRNPSAKITIGRCGFFNSTTLSVEGEGKIDIGDNAYFNNPSIKATDSSITFKEQCIVSDATLVDTDFHSLTINRRNPEVQAKTKPIYVEENVWIGSQSMVLKGVTIGKNSVIGAGTIVRQSVPANVVVIGNPQQIVKELDTTVLPYEFPK
jgi:acetyltransferase-like isoleucine patch superfamily enzyme